mmetsp:Transcript_20270/g.59780  ORF Transcript_20270/g.59780 Transcript_20270/m.59780 type:complete len:238 (+) Transcript_20270:616-1329(+)
MPAPATHNARGLRRRAGGVARSALPVTMAAAEAEESVPSAAGPQPNCSLAKGTRRYSLPRMAPQLHAIKTPTRRTSRGEPRTEAGGGTHTKARAAKGFAATAHAARLGRARPGLLGRVSRSATAMPAVMARSVHPRAMSASCSPTAALRRPTDTGPRRTAPMRTASTIANAPVREPSACVSSARQAQHNARKIHTDPKQPEAVCSTRTHRRDGAHAHAKASRAIPRTERHMTGLRPA